MATTLGNKVIHAIMTRANYTSLATKNEDTLYFVTDTDGIQLYKGSTLVSSSFKVLASNPANASGMQEGVLYLAPNLKLYYKNSSGNLSTAFDIDDHLVKDANVATDKTIDTKAPTLKAMYSAISAEISSAMSGTFRNSILAPVADVAALKAVTGMSDKDVIFVESLNAIFSYDAESEATDNTSDNTSPTIVAPTTSGVGGRWLRTSSSNYSFSSTDFIWSEDDGLSLNPTKISSILSDAEAYVTAHNADTNTTAHSALFSAKLNKPSTDGSEGQYLVRDSSTGATKWIEGIRVVSSEPTVTTSDNGKIFYNKATDKFYVVEAGVLVQKSYSKADIDAKIKTQGINTVENIANESFTAANNGEVYYDLTTDELYEIEGGTAVRKSYSKSNADTAISTAVTNHNDDTNTTAHAALFTAINNDIKWNTITIE